MKGSIDQVTGTEEKGDKDEGVEREQAEAEERKEREAEEAEASRSRRGLAASRWPARTSSRRRS